MIEPLRDEVSVPEDMSLQDLSPQDLSLQDLSPQDLSLRPPRRLIVGLGNPGARYDGTRHNVGFAVIELLAERRGIRLDRRDCNVHWGWDEQVALVAPQTFMNRSGFATRCLRERFAFEPGELLIVYDEVHLPLGHLRLRPKGSPAGHRGMESVLENLGSDQVPRLRLGVAAGEGPPEGGEALVRFVLEPFEDAEQGAVTAMVARAAEACEVWALEGVEPAMQRFNGPAVGTEDG